MAENSSLNSLTSRAAQLEVEYSNTKKSKERANSTFRVDFRYEHRFLTGDTPPSIHSDGKNNSKPGYYDDIKDTLSNSFKKLRNELAKMVHPDKHDGDEEKQAEFKEIQTAFEEGNVSKLIETADRYDVDVNLDDSDIAAVKEIMRRQSEYIHMAQTSLEWAWMNCGRSNEDRQDVWKYINIDGSKFEPWLNARGYSLMKLERECMHRRQTEVARKVWESEVSPRPRRPKSRLMIR